MSEKKQKIYECSKCGAQSSKWNGRCLECGGWGTLIEGLSTGKAVSGAESLSAVPAETSLLSTVAEGKEERLMTGIGELDRVLGGGLVPGSLILLAGEPGIGKSTLLAQMVDSVSQRLKTLYVSGEESAPQVRDRFRRLACDLGSILFASETDIDRIRASAVKEAVSLLVVDSIQTMRSSEAPGEAGSVSQIRASTVALLELAKKRGISIIVTGHITKDGQVAGPKSLEHIVDTVLYLEHDQSLQYRLLRSSKNRFGAISEIGIFEMRGSGFNEVTNPGLIFMDEHKEALAGAAVSCLLEGTRSFMVEVQALVTRTIFGYPQRKATGIDVGRLQVLSAVLEKRAGLKLGGQDIILNIVGGLRVKEPALDLAICAAIISSLSNRPLSKKTVFLGEVGLGGEIRNIAKLEERLREASRLGFDTAYIPAVKLKKPALATLPLFSLSELARELIGK
jgi:DNA repair protein RadA/Sms